MSDSTSVNSDAAAVSKEVDAATPLAPILVGRSGKLMRRARRACLSCRARKVRCDVTIRMPCGNCIHDDLECILVSRRKKKPLAHLKQLSADTQYTDFSNDNISPEVDKGTLRIRPYKPGDVERRQPRVFDDETNPLHNDELNEIMSNSNSPSSVLAPSCSGVVWPCNLLSSHDRLQLSPTPTVISTLPGFVQDDTQLYTTTAQSIHVPHTSLLPGFIEPLTTSLSQEDVAYLKAKGAFTLPSQELRTSLLKAFVEFVYPDLPVVDPSWLIGVFDTQKEGARRISLMLLQAILFSGAAYVKMESLAKEGFASRIQARGELFHRVQLLHDFNYEASSTVLVQSFLLMSSWYGSSTDGKSPRHWIDLAISKAITGGLNMQPSSRLSDEDQRLHRRLWWTCYIRDRLLSLAFETPPRIKDEIFCIEILTKADFELCTRVRCYDDEQIATCTPASAGDVSIQEIIVAIYIAKANLCRCLKFHTNSSHFAYNDSFTSSSETSTVDIYSLVSSSQDLARWEKSLPDYCRYQPVFNEIVHVDTQSQTIFVLRALLDMIYNASQITLQRSWLKTLQQAPCAWPLEEETARHRELDAARRISDVANDVHKKGLTALFPTTAITAVASSAAVHLQEINSSKAANKDDALEGYRRCLRVLRMMQDLSKAATVARTALGYALEESLDIRQPLKHEEHYVWSAPRPNSEHLKNTTDDPGTALTTTLALGGLASEPETSKRNGMLGERSDVQVDDSFVHLKEWCNDFIEPFKLAV